MTHFATPGMPLDASVHL